MSESALKPSVKPSTPFQTSDFVNFSQENFMERIAQTMLLPSSHEDLDIVAVQKQVDISIQQLIRVGEQMEVKANALQDSVGEEEVKYYRRLEELNHNLEAIFSSFKQLDRRINNVGATAVRIGDRLETCDSQRKNAEEAKALVTYFQQFNCGDSSKLDPLFQEPDQAAPILRQLMAISEELDLASIDTQNSVVRKKSLNSRLQVGIDSIQSFTNEMELNILDKFEEGYVSGNLEEMKEYASILVDLNGGASCYQRYLGTRDYIGDVDEAVRQIISSLPPDDNNSRALDIGINNFCEGVKMMLAKEYDIITHVFPSPEKVMGMLLLRVFELRLMNFVTSLVESTDAVSPRTYLAALAVAYEKIGEMACELSMYKVGDLNMGSLMDSMFCEHKEAFMGKQLLVLDLEYRKELERTNASARQHTRRAGEGSHSPNSTVLSAEFAIKLVDLHTEAQNLGRKLATPGSFPHFVVDLGSSLLRQLGEYLNYSIEKELEGLPGVSDKGLPTQLSFFEAVHVGNTIVQCLQRHFQHEIMPDLVEHPQLQATCISRKMAVVSAVEAKVVTGITRSLEIIVGQVERILRSEQKKSDFRPKEAAFELDPPPTKACSETVAFLTTHHGYISQYLDGRNLQSVCLEIGSRLLNNIKRFTISIGGALQLMRDMNEYQTFIGMLNVPALDGKVDAIRELINIFLVPPDNVRSVVDETRISNLDNAEVFKYVQLRDDFKNAKIAKYFPEL